ncbi:hypothetical protein VNO77_43757 [Canavalia gladiata]|uniref:Uncharacterized protein n=1 Tax=Canavalia gladiata TaxID=3824 RepID=A0AAN9JUT4_CANGL
MGSGSLVSFSLRYLLFSISYTKRLGFRDGTCYVLWQINQVITKATSGLHEFQLAMSEKKRRERKRRRGRVESEN